MTVSIGCATLVPGENDIETDLLNRADQALYEAKANGRDQLICVEMDRAVRAAIPTYMATTDSVFPKPIS